MAHDVFISYPHENKAVADAVCASLEADAIRCWIAPRDVRPGDEWSASIIGAIASSRVVVLVFSTYANASPQVAREIQAAFEHGVAVIPMRIEDVPPTGSFEYYLGPVHWLDALTPPLEAHLHRLIETVRAFLAGSAPTDRSRAEERGRGDVPTPPAAPVGRSARTRKRPSLRSRWMELAVVLLMLLVVSSAWFRTPPADDTAISFAMAGLPAGVAAALVYVAMTRWRSRKHGVAWTAIAILGLVASLVTLWLYDSWSDRFVAMYQGKRYVVGDRLTEDGQAWVQTSGTTNPTQLLFDIGGKPEFIWTAESITRMRSRLQLAFYASFPLMVITLLATLQAVYCASLERRPG